jgi:prepilin-type N-terminal cleavage/methylation domain-containing protein
MRLSILQILCSVGVFFLFYQPNGLASSPLIANYDGDFYYAFGRSVSSNRPSLYIGNQNNPNVGPDYNFASLKWSSDNLTQSFGSLSSTEKIFLRLNIEPFEAYTAPPVGGPPPSTNLTTGVNFSFRVVKLLADFTTLRSANKVDYYNTNYATSQTVGPNYSISSTGQHLFDVTSLVQDWISTPSQNFGLGLVGVSDSTPFTNPSNGFSYGATMVFASTENGNLSFAPALIPEPGSGPLLTGALAIYLILRSSHRKNKSRPMKNFERNRIKGRSGFTLVELLCVVFVLALFAALGHGAYSRVLTASKKTAEVSAAKNLIQAYLLASQDNHGQLLKAYDFTAVAKDANGNSFAPRRSENYRWPWRLAPYLSYQLYGSMLVNEAETYIRSAGGMSATYYISVMPSLGLNAGFVGGHDREEPLAALIDRQLCVQRFEQSVSPSKLIVFASAETDMMGEKYKGSYYVTSPRYPDPWAPQFSATADPATRGFVDPRFSGQAVVACLAGNVEVLSYEELKDMRRWANEAALQNNPNWAP